MGSVDIPPFLREKMKEKVQQQKNGADIPPFLKKKEQDGLGESTNISPTSTYPLESQDAASKIGEGAGNGKRGTLNVVPEYAANPLLPRTDNVFEIPSAKIFTNDGTEINIPNAGKLGLTNDVVKSIQDRVSNKTATQQDIDILSTGTGKTPNVISAYITKGKDAGELTEFEDVKIKKNQNLSSLVERVNSQFGLGIAPEVLNSPQALSNYLTDIEQRYQKKAEQDEQALRQSMKAAPGTDRSFASIRKFVQESQDKIKEVKAQNAEELATVKSAIVDKIKEQIALDPNIKGDDKVKQILNLTQKREQNQINEAQVKRQASDIYSKAINTYNPVGRAIDKLLSFGDDEDEEVLNADKAFVERGVSQKIGEQVYYNNIRKQNLLNEATEKQKAGLLTDEERNNYAAKIQEIDKESETLKTDFTPRKQLYEKYPILLKKDVVNEVNDFNAKRSSNVVGGGAEYRNGVSLEEHLKANGYDLKNPVVRDVILEARTGTLWKGNLKDYSLFGRLGSDFKDVFISSAKSIGDVTGIRDEADVLADKKEDELFPTQVGEQDEYKLTGKAKTIQNVAGTTGQVLGQGILQAGTMNLGRLAGLTKVAAANTAFWGSGAVTSYDNAYKDSYDFIDTPIGRTTYAGLIALANAASEKIFPEAKIFQVSGVKEAFSELASKAGTKELTKTLTKELLNKGKNAAVEYVKKFGSNVGKEVAEEVGTSIFESGMRFLYGDPKMDIEKAIEQAKETAYQTATGMALIGGIGAHKDISKERNLSARSVIYNAAVYNDEAIDAINKGYKQGLYSAIEKDQKIQTVHTAMRAVKAVDQIEELYQKELPRAQREIYVGNLTAEALLKKQFDQLPENDQTDEVGKDIQEKIKNLQEQRKQIVKDEVTINEFGDAVAVVKPKENKTTETIEIAPKENVPTEKAKVAVILPETAPKPNIISSPKTEIDENQINEEGGSQNIPDQANQSSKENIQEDVLNQEGAVAQTAPASESTPTVPLVEDKAKKYYEENNIDEASPIYYHGTTEEAAAKIKNDGFYKEYNVNITTDLSEAKEYAEGNAEDNGGKPAIIKVRLKKDATPKAEEGLDSMAYDANDVALDYSEIKPSEPTAIKDKGEQPTETKTEKPRSKLLDLADKIEKEGFLPSWLQADLPEGTQIQGFNFNKAVADAIRLVDAAIEKGVEISKAIEEGFNSIRQHYKDNNAKIKGEEKLKEQFAKFVTENYTAEEKEPTPKELAAQIKSGELNYNDVIEGKDEVFIQSVNDELFGKGKKSVSFDDEAFKSQVRKLKEVGQSREEIIEAMGAAKKLTKQQKELVAEVFGETAEQDKIAAELQEAFKSIAKGEKPKSVLKRLSVSSVTDLVDALKNALTYTTVSNEQLEKMADYIVDSIDLSKADQYINAIISNSKQDIKQLIRAKVIVALQKEGQNDLATRLINDMADEATEAGRQTQSLKRAYEILGAKGNPATRTAFMRRVVEMVQKKAASMTEHLTEVIGDKDAEIAKINEQLHKKAQASSLINQIKNVISDLCGLRNKK